jgi:hypothetical protein
VNNWLIFFIILAIAIVPLAVARYRTLDTRFWLAFHLGVVVTAVAVGLLVGAAPREIAALFFLSILISLIQHLRWWLQGRPPFRWGRP